MEVPFNRWISSNVARPLCLTEKESILHALWGYRKLSPIRNGCRPAFDILFKLHPSFLEFIFSCFSQLLHEEFEVLSIVLWRVWFQHNRAVHNQHVMNAIDIVPWANVALVTPFLHAPFRPRFASLLLMEIDASVHLDLGLVGLGAIVRDTSGQVLLTEACDALLFLDVAFAESTTLRFGLILDKEAGLWLLQVESSCQSVVNNILAKCIPHSKIGLVFEDILALFDGCLVESLSFVSRSANKGAHF
ncbi:hypothetical protein ACOSP7_022198 [Xanthoceras sorbifolium]